MRSWWFLVLLCLVTRLPALRYDVISDDEAIYEAMGRTIADGGVMYRDTIDHKPPGLAYTYALVRIACGGRSRLAIDAIHVLGLLVVLVTALALAAIARRLALDGTWAAIGYVLVSAIKSPVDGLAVNGELMLNLPTALALLCVLEAGKRPGARGTALDALAGALACIAGLYKYQGFAIGLVLPVVWASRRASARALTSAALSTALGTALVVGAVITCFAAHHALAEAVDWALLFNRRYLAEGPTLGGAATRLCMQLVGIVLPGLLFYAAGFVGLLAVGRRRGWTALIVIVWTALTVGCVTLGGRFFGHYFVQLELPLSLAASPILAAWSVTNPRRVALGCILPTLLFFTIAMLPTQTRPWLNPDDPDVAAIGRAIAEMSTPDETLWVWGNVPQLYYAADRRPGVRYTFCNYLTGLSPATPSEDDASVDSREHEVPGAWSLAMRDLEVHPPAIIVDTAAAGLKSYGKYPIAAYPALALVLQQHYMRVAQVDGVVLWRRIDRLRR